jgi:hypothetical protein
MKFVILIILLLTINIIFTQSDNEEAENKKFKQMLEEYEKKMAEKKPVEPDPRFVAYKDHIKNLIMSRARYTDSTQ